MKSILTPENLKERNDKGVTAVADSGCHSLFFQTCQISISVNLFFIRTICVKYVLYISCITQGCLYMLNGLKRKDSDSNFATKLFAGSISHYDAQFRASFIPIFCSIIVEQYYIFVNKL